MSQDLIDGVLRWEDPPPPTRRNPRTPGGATAAAERAVRIAAELRARPGEWAVIAEGANSRVLTTRIRHGVIAVWRPAGAYEAVCRTVDGRITVFARYVGAAR
ncbi:hypothetical protein V6V47_26480 [Micromonospora sp. CPCC 205539]|uniref:hypothetical protein n=1 Tax=Micromonospora sp. CPCC 205539 TaxID=3122408 RepID=UPI002FF311E9